MEMEEKVNLSIDSTLALNDGTRIPRLGLGCYKAFSEEVKNAVRWAVEAGYRQIDTASFYSNEKDVSIAIKESGASRESLYVVSKVWPTCYGDPVKAVEFSLRELDLEYIDCYLLHWPGIDEDARYRMWETMLNYREKGYLKSIGVSNFAVPHLEGLTDKFGVLPVINQVELHPLSQQVEIREYCDQKKIAITAWAPLIRGRIAELPLLSELAEKYRKTIPQIAIRWHLQKGRVVIPKSSHKERIEENVDIFDFSIEEKDIQAIDQLDRKEGTSKDPFTFDGGDFQLPD